MQSMLNNPEVLRSMISANPALQQARFPLLSRVSDYSDQLQQIWPKASAEKGIRAVESVNRLSQDKA